MSVFATSLAPSMAISAESDLGTTRPCTTCSRRRLLNTDPYKRCGDCREKGRIRARETQKKKRDSIREGMIKEMGKIEKEEMQEKTEKTEKKRKRAEKQEDGKQPKKRAKQILNSVDVNRKNGVPKVKSSTPEYQLASELYKSLQTATSSKVTSFSGSYSIVAVPDITNEKRAKLVAKDIRKHVPFNRKMNKFAGENITRKHTLLFKCDCSTPAPDAMTTTSTDPKTVQRTNSGLATWLKANKSQSSSGKPCNGMIKVVSRDDNSHERLKGQKVTITVTHGT